MTPRERRLLVALESLLSAYDAAERDPGSVIDIDRARVRQRFESSLRRARDVVREAKREAMAS